ncbi:uncharacterized protein LOC120349757 [Nilaparvata lugens]|uniref:uncharacterized protein LOC120349757 n=1 Tax=Nilaparvata lugens TaxID=108931 RepID=UPI00193CEFAD|nr:uncharacterized protein LOC120349757 [Nilaparvata lugens]XP_039276259.1 uncharacterized protein LOC120349757 [Nilaparvata lugens]XP_039276260.1 uncharacterized protein LOC120349757 [Nilaparvata lugens]
MADQVRAVLEHYKDNPDPVGLPDTVYKIPDPMPIPTIRQTSGYATLTMFNCSVYGLSRFRIESVYTNLAELQMVAELRIENLEVRGNYTLTSWLSRSADSCMVKLSDVYVVGLAEMSIAREGHLQASRIDMDISVDEINLDFQNLGFLASLFQGMMNSVGVFVFDSIKPFILNAVNADLRNGIDKAAREIKMTFPNSIPPLDLAIAEGRKRVMSLGYDPYMFPDYSQSAGMFGMYMTNMWVTGLGSFYRVGNMTVSMQNHVVQIGVSVGTDELMGNCHWQISAAGLYSHAGATSFTVEYVQVEAKLNQALDIRKHPVLESLDMTVGNIQLRHEGTGSLDYALELLVNLLPNILRYQIVDALEDPLRRRFQEILNSVDVEKIINEEIPKLEKMISQTKTLQVK